MTTRLAGNISLVLVVASMFLLAVFQTIEVLQARANLNDLYATQEAPLQEAAKVRHQFDAFAAGISELAGEGNTNAKTVIDEMRREGVTLPAPKR